MSEVRSRIEHMSEALTDREVKAEVDDLTPSRVLARLRSARRQEDAAAAEQLALAATWADLHPPESIHDAATFATRSTRPGSEHEEPIAGAGCPTVAEFCVAELGTVLEISTTSAKRLMGHALELRHRLPRLWARVHKGQVPAWRARLVAEATIHATPALTAEAAGWVDTQVAGLAAKVGVAQLDRLVAEAVKRHHLTDQTIDHDDGLGIDRRHVTVDRDNVHYTGTIAMEAVLGIADAIDVDRALTHRAAEYQALGSTDSLDVRRSRALGDLARLQTSLDLTDRTPLSVGATRPASPSRGTAADRPPAGALPDGVTLPPARQVVLHAHFDATALADGTVRVDEAGRLEEGQRLVLLDQVMSWCRDSSTTVVVKPVIDLNTAMATDAYAIPDRIREQVVLRDTTCVFPWCTRPARACQIDHVVPHDPTAAADGRPQPGPTATHNLAALCTRHHRLKTHGRWRYTVTGPGSFQWTSPHGYTYRRDPTGTQPLNAEPGRSRIDIPRPRRSHPQPGRLPDRP